MAEFLRRLVIVAFCGSGAAGFFYSAVNTQDETEGMIAIGMVIVLGAVALTTIQLQFEDDSRPRR